MKQLMKRPPPSTSAQEAMQGSGHRDLLDERPGLNRGASKEAVDSIRNQLHTLDKQIKSLSREGSTLKADLDAAKAKNRGSLVWDNMKNLPMKQIMAMRAPLHRSPLASG
jgi:hypothetical protein